MVKVILSILMLSAISCSSDLGKSHFVINEFIVPAKSSIEFEKVIQDHLGLLRKQDGIAFSGLYKEQDVSDTIHYTSIVKWTDENSFAKAQQVIASEMEQFGFDYRAFNNKFGITVIQRPYKEILVNSTE